MADSERQVIVRIRAEVEQFRTAMSQASQSAKDLARDGRAAGQQAEQGLGQATDAADDTASALDAAGNAASGASDGLSDAAGAAGELADSTTAVADGAGDAASGMDEAAAAAAALASAQGDVADASGTAADATDAAAGSAGNASSTIEQLTADAEEHGDAWEDTGENLLGFGAAVIAVVGVAVTKYAEFDKAMSSVAAATHASADEMTAFREAAMVAGADTSYSAAEAANAIEELSKAGVSADDILSGGLNGSLALAAAGSLEVGAAAELAATAMTQFGLSGQDIPHIADLLAAGAGKAQGSVEDLGMALNQAGLVAAATGMSIESTTGVLAAFASAGLTGSDAGTSLKSMLQHLQAPSSIASAEMEKLGISLYDANGEFAGMSSLADQLKGSLSGATDAERDHSMAVIFGADAVRAANVLYEQGGEGIQDWTDKVNDAGYAATTAAIMQDNLAGDLEKLGGSFDTVFIKAGGSAAEALRTLVQAGESVVDTIGKIPSPVLESTTAIAGIAGGAALAAGGILKLTPMVLDGVKSFRSLGTAGSRIPGTMGKVAKGAAVATIAIAALAAVAKATSKDVTFSTEAMANSMLGLSKSGGEVEDLNKYFHEWDTFFGSATVNSIDSVQGAIARLADPNFQDKMEDSVGNPLKALGAPDGAILQVREKFELMGESLGNLVSNGAADTAAASFNKLAKEFEAQGMSAQEALDVLPGYEKSLLSLGNSVGVTLSEQELLDLAMGKIPASMEAAGYSAEGLANVVGAYTDATGAAIPITEEMAEALAEMGITASGAVVELGKYVELLFQAGLMTMSTRDAQRSAIEAQMAFDEALATNGMNLDINTEAGRANEAALDGVAQARITVMQAMAEETDAYGNNVYSQEQLQGALRTTYDQLYNNAFAMTGNAGAADNLTRKVLGIPDNANIDTWMSDYARAMADRTTGAVSNIPKFVGISIQVFGAAAAHAALGGIAGAAANAMAAANRASAAAANAGPPGGFTGGAVSDIMGMYAGGIIPGNPPAARNKDNILALVNGRPLAVRSGEFIVNEDRTREHRPLLEAINSGEYTGTSARSTPEYAPVQLGMGALSATGHAAPAQFVGDLYLDSGEFLGKVQGVARQEADHAITRLDTTISHLSRGGVYARRNL